MAREYNVSAQAMKGIIACESGWNPSIQSNHRYSATNAPVGFRPGDREQSFGLVQVHLPAHPHISKQQAKDPQFAIHFLAENLRAGRARMWYHCSQQLALL